VAGEILKRDGKEQSCTDKHRYVHCGVDTLEKT
jgi:hypothetical protein